MGQKDVPKGSYLVGLGPTAKEGEEDRDFYLEDVNQDVLPSLKKGSVLILKNPRKTNGDIRLIASLPKTDTIVGRVPQEDSAKLRRYVEGDGLIAKVTEVDGETRSVRVSVWFGT